MRRALVILFLLFLIMLFADCSVARENIDL
jgi:hypothetical protein